jgi:Tol biopolymer transport system component
LPLSPNSKLGPYQVVSQIGAGGMGEVYAARDTRLNRDVAIKVLPADVASDPERVRRFEDEARAVATLAHPNILAIHDVGEQGGLHYLVTELLDGHSLRDALQDGPLSPRRASEYAVQIANGLAAAHVKGIVHRDLKPENIYLTRDGHAKILDFGLAKQTKSKAAAAEGATLTSSHTAPGTVMGTAAYMAPEQVRGEATDARTDIFALGLILYEMLSGGPAFKRTSSVETMSAILKEDAPDFPAGTAVPPAVDRIIRRCLEKNPDQRFQSAKDMAFALEALSGSSSAQRQLAAPAAPKRRWLVPVLAAVAALAVAAVVVFALRPEAGGPTAITQLTFRYGYIRMARFAPDGQGVIYGAMWDGGPMQLYQGRVDSDESQPIQTSPADLLSVSKTGDLAVSLNRRFLSPWVPTGTVARVAAMGGAPRPLFQDTLDADWSPDGSGLVIVHPGHGRYQLEYSGKVLYENDGYISHPRFSPDGKLIAFADHPLWGDDRGSIKVVDLSGNARKLGGEYSSIQGIAWRPDGKEIWFGGLSNIQAVDLNGKERVVYRAVGRVRLQDIAADGKVLLTTDDVRSDIFAGTAGGSESRNLAVLPFCAGGGLSADGQTVAINTFQTTDYEMWIRKVDGSPAVRVGSGAITDITPDAKAVLSIQASKPDHVTLVPTGVGEPKVLPSSGLAYQYGTFAGDTKHAVVLASSGGRPARLFFQDFSSNEPPRPISPEGVSVSPWSRFVSPDGKYAVARPPQSSDPDKPAPAAMIYPTDGSAPRPANGVQPGEFVTAWLTDNRTMLVFPLGENPAVLYKVDTVTGKRELWHKFTLADPTGILSMRSVFVTPDARHYSYTTRRVLSNLYVVDGLK